MSNEEFAVEIVFLNWAERITICHEKFIDFLKNRYVDRNREFTILKAYGWHDYVVILRTPLSNPTTLDQQITDEGWNCVESSLLGWVLKTDGNNTGRHYWGIIKRIEGILPELNLNKVDTTSHALYVLSLISINREFNEKYDTDLGSCIEWGRIIHCVGIWDIAIVVKIKKDGNPIEHIEAYKKLFLYGISDDNICEDYKTKYIKRSSSTILVGLTKEEYEKILEKAKYKGYNKFEKLFKPTLEDFFAGELNDDRL